MNNINQNITSSKTALLSDESLYDLCKQYGERARIWRQRFAGLLPEVFKRKLYEKKGFISIFEFSKKLAGMSEEQVRLVLNLEKRFEEMPKLKTLLTEGKVSVNKLSRIVSIAKPENEIFLATQVQILSKSAVETLVRDEKFAEENKNQNGLQESFFDTKSLPGQTLDLSSEVQQKLLELQEKGIDINDLLLEFLQKREEEIAQKKEEISREISEKETEKQDNKTSVDSRKASPASPSRHIPISIKRILYAQHGTKCSIKNCQKLSQQIHHIQRFSAVPSHDPNYLAPLCREHHELAHTIDVPNGYSDWYSADIAYREIRQRVGD
ncbi:HNH endonuclease [Candidatus Gracilibacteria bacterium]|jgi:hypothetical protein|nr:HNH endonuclease [Candidatus Gracilibacteria bacterium]